MLISQQPKSEDSRKTFCVVKKVAASKAFGYRGAYHSRHNEQVLLYDRSPFEFRSSEQFTASRNSAILGPIGDQCGGQDHPPAASRHAPVYKEWRGMRFYSLRTGVLFGLVAFVLMANGGAPGAAAQLVPPASPSVALSASPSSVQAGQPVTLTWSSTNATSIILEPSVGRLVPQGSRTVHPTQSTTYTVTAMGPGGSAHANAQVTITPAPSAAAVQDRSKEEISSDQRQMRGLDEQIQEIKSDALRMSAELSQLEEKLLYPSGTQVAIFVELAKGDTMRLDAVRLQIDGQLVAHYIYSAKELQALRKGGVQRIYVGNVATGDHKLDVVVDGKLEDGADFSRTGQFTFRKEVKPKMVGLTLAGPRSGNTPIALGDW
jgi:hypothetical protein